jgi:hypothetical protein
MEYAILFPAAEQNRQGAAMFVACAGVILAALALFGWSVWSSANGATTIPRLVYQVSACALARTSVFRLFVLLKGSPLSRAVGVAVGRADPAGPPPYSVENSSF